MRRHPSWLLAVIVTFGIAASCGDDPPNTGATCTATAGCDKGLTCDEAIPGGYCTKACSTAGSRDECPDGSVCTTISGATLSCAKICSLQTDCRPEHECNGVTDSEVKACKLKQK